MWAPLGVPVSMFRSANPRTVATHRLAAIRGASIHQLGDSPLEKLVPDSPPKLCVGPGLSHEEVIKRAAEHLKKAILRAAYLPEPPDARHREMLSDSLMNMRISKALLALAVAAPPLTVEV